MAVRETLIEACAAAPDDDAPRLVLADAIGGERGEFIVVQCALAQGRRSPAEAGALRRRQRELVAAHGVAWSGLAGLAKRVTFRRGFVDAAELDARTVALRAEAIVAAAPLLRHVMLSGMITRGREFAPAPPADPLIALGDALARPELRRLHGLRFDSIGTLYDSDVYGMPPMYEGREGPAIRRALDAGVLAGMRSFAAPRVDAATVQALIASGQLAGVERLHSQLSAADTLAVVAHLPRLAALELEDLRLAPAELPATLVELHVAGADLWGLADLPLAGRLERLTLEQSQIRHDPWRLAAFTRLRTLHLSELAPSYHADEKQVAARFAALSLPALREVCASGLTTAAALALAQRFGPQLELLDLRGSTSELHARRGELAALVAGEVRTGAWEQPRELAFLGGPPLDATLVELPR